MVNGDSGARRCGLAEGGGRWSGWLGAWRTGQIWWVRWILEVVMENGDGWKLEEDGGYGGYGGSVDFEDDVDEDGGGFVKKKVARRWWTVKWCSPAMIVVEGEDGVWM
ncbi:hypothetical protein PIB30_097879 [Stylosanthes scabra]|uniref:Uncharacterized protein n=1 Tax=Stylosanthes scabra TaxID=79078 RepID=A0ABU6RXD3_9FABA|nr:hypothetical protein [Stylosanthes scabra]